MIEKNIICIYWRRVQHFHGFRTYYIEQWTPKFGVRVKQMILIILFYFIVLGLWDLWVIRSISTDKWFTRNSIGNIPTAKFWTMDIGRKFSRGFSQNAAFDICYAEWSFPKRGEFFFCHNELNDCRSIDNLIFAHYLAHYSLWQNERIGDQNIIRTVCIFSDRLFELSPIICDSIR